MSLSSFLLTQGGVNAIDTELDALFTLSPPAASSSQKPTQPTLAPDPSEQKNKKRKRISAETPAKEPYKRSKPKSTDLPEADKHGGKSVRKKERKNKSQVEKEEVHSEEEDADAESSSSPTKMQPEDEDKEDAKKTKPDESPQKTRPNRSGSKVKYAPADETTELRDQRTIFVGNLPIEIAQKRPLLKRLQRHIISLVPTAKIESTRFRSIPFQSSTAKPSPESPEDKTNAKPSNKPSSRTKPAREHDIDRISQWRSQKEKDKDGEGNVSEKKYLDPSQKKKIAFINHEFHSTADAVNAYVVFAHPVPPEERRPNLPPPPIVMDPYEAAITAARLCDGTEFMDRVIRVDLVGKKGLHTKPTKNTKNDTIEEVDKTADLSEFLGTDPKSTVFVGNLDFAAKETDLRVFFEGVVSAERGPPPLVGGPQGDAEFSQKSKSWVTRVRVIRDKDSQLGKGFAYIQFADHECVDEVVALEPSKLKFAKRKLRVQRCRTLPGAATAGAGKSSKSSKSTAKTPKQPSTPVVVPKGDPALGEKLAHLSKEARKQYKSADGDRVARRLAKKKARMAMGAGKLKMPENGRERARKKSRGVTGSEKKKAGAKKGRVRSEKSLEKRNGKKSSGNS